MHWKACEGWWRLADDVVGSWRLAEAVGRCQGCERRMRRIKTQGGLVMEGDGGWHSVREAGEGKGKFMEVSGGSRLAKGG
jgi:hypothetical protein